MTERQARRMSAFAGMPRLHLTANLIACVANDRPMNRLQCVVVAVMFAQRLRSLVRRLCPPRNRQPIGRSARGAGHHALGPHERRQRSGTGRHRIESLISYSSERGQGGGTCLSSTLIPDPSPTGRGGFFINPISSDSNVLAPCHRPEDRRMAARDQCAGGGKDGGAVRLKPASIHPKGQSNPT